MDLPAASAHSFIIRMWLEEEATETQGAVWRGSITHVPSGEQRYIESLQDMSYFMLPYMKMMGINPDDDLQTGHPSKAGHI